MPDTRRKVRCTSKVGSIPTGRMGKDDRQSQRKPDVQSNGSFFGEPHNQAFPGNIGGKRDE